jgi:rod shape-determining protein MreB
MTTPCRDILYAVRSLLEKTEPELVADISRNGITLTGGGSLLYGFDQLIYRSTGIACHVADDAILCVALGCGKSLGWIDQMQEGTINLARQKLMSEG